MNRPEICIGLNERFDEKLVEKLIYTLKDFNYTYAINEPFFCHNHSEFNLIKF